MIKYLFNNTDIFTANGIKVIKVTGLMDGAAIRVTKHEWPDKSGTDIDESTIRYKEREITIECLCTAADRQNLLTQMEAFNAAIKGVGVFSIRGDYRAAYLVLSEKELTGKYYRTVNGVAYLFTLKLTDVNPKATKFITNTRVRRSVTANTTEPTMVYWGNGQRSLIDAAGTHSHYYNFVGDIDIIIDGDGITTIEKIAYRYGENLIRTSSQGQMYFEMKLSKPAALDHYYLLISSYSGFNEYGLYNKIADLYVAEITAENQIITNNLIIPANVYVAIATYGTLNDIPVGDSMPYGIINRLTLADCGVNMFQVENYSTVKYELNLSNNSLTANDVNRIFEDLRWALDNVLNLGMATGGIIDISGGANAAPSSAYNDVIERLTNEYGWTIITN